MYSHMMRRVGNTCFAEPEHGCTTTTSANRGDQLARQVTEQKKRKRKRKRKRRKGCG